MLILSLGLAVLLATFALASRRVLARFGTSVFTFLGFALVVVGAESIEWRLTWGSAAAVLVPLLAAGAVSWYLRSFRRRNSSFA